MVDHQHNNGLLYCIKVENDTRRDKLVVSACQRSGPGAQNGQGHGADDSDDEGGDGHDNDADRGGGDGQGNVGNISPGHDGQGGGGNNSSGAGAGAGPSLGSGRGRFAQSTPAVTGRGVAGGQAVRGATRGGRYHPYRSQVKPAATASEVMRVLYQAP